MTDKKIEKIVKHAEVSEKAIERYLCDVVKRLGGVCLKYSNAGAVGYPDRIAVMPNGRCIWVELKSRGQKPTTIQKIRIKHLESLGHHVYVVDSKVGVDNIFTSLGYEL